MSSGNSTLWTIVSFYLLWGLGVLAFWGFIAYIAFHFIAKFW